MVPCLPIEIRSRSASIPEERANERKKADPAAISGLGIGQRNIDEPSLLSQVLNIVAEECGIDQSELSDLISFADLGVDSLMQFARSSRIREELSLEISSSLFIDDPTVGPLKSYIRSLNDDRIPEYADESVSSATASHCKRNPSSIFSVTDGTILSTEDMEDWGSNNSDHKDGKEIPFSPAIFGKGFSPIDLTHTDPGQACHFFPFAGKSKDSYRKAIPIPRWRWLSYFIYADT